MSGWQSGRIWQDRKMTSGVCWWVLHVCKREGNGFPWSVWLGLYDGVFSGERGLLRDADFGFFGYAVYYTGLGHLGMSIPIGALSTRYDTDRCRGLSYSMRTKTVTKVQCVINQLRWICV